MKECRLIFSFSFSILIHTYLKSFLIFMDFISTSWQLSSSFLIISWPKTVQPQLNFSVSYAFSPLLPHYYGVLQAWLSLMSFPPKGYSDACLSLLSQCSLNFFFIKSCTQFIILSLIQKPSVKSLLSRINTPFGFNSQSTVYSITDYFPWKL